MFTCKWLKVKYEDKVWLRGFRLENLQQTLKDSKRNSGDVKFAGDATRRGRRVTTSHPARVCFVYVQAASLLLPFDLYGYGALKLLWWQHSNERLYQNTFLPVSSSVRRAAIRLIGLSN